MPGTDHVAPRPRRSFMRLPRPLWIGLATVAGFVLAFVFVLLPAVKQARDSGTKYTCRGRMRNLYLAMLNYAEEHGGQFPDLETGSPARPPQSWRVTVLPFLGRENVYSTYSPSLAWDKPANRVTAQTRIEELFCVDNHFPADESGRLYTAYAAVSGPKTAFPGGKAMNFDAIRKADGLAQTILLGECSGLKIVWTEPRDIDTSKQKIGVNFPGDGARSASSILSSPHRGGAFVVFADGGVKFLSEKIDSNVLKALTTATGGENVPSDFQP